MELMNAKNVEAQQALLDKDLDGSMTSDSQDDSSEYSNKGN